MVFLNSYRQLIVEYLKQSGVPRTSLYTSFYIENFLNPMMKPEKTEDDTYILPMQIPPDSLLFLESSDL
jgi:hypothetical protein